MKPFLLFLILASLLCAMAPVDSLLEEGGYRLEVLGRPDSAAAAFRQALSEAGEDADAAEQARRGLKRSLLLDVGESGEAATADSLIAVSSRPLLRWRRTFGDWHLHRALACGGAVLVQSGDGVVSALDTATGRPLWNRPGVDPDAVPATDGVLAAFAGLDGGVAVLNPRDGRLLWGLAGRSSAPVLAAWRGTLFVNAGGRLAAHVLRTGQLLWERPLEFGPAFSGTAAAGFGCVLFQRSDGVFQCHDTENGRMLWASGSGSSDPVLTQDFVYLRRGRELRALGRLSGKMAWNRTVADEISDLALLSERELALLGGNGELLILDARNGEALSSALARPGRLMAAGDKILILDAQGSVSCSRADGRVLWRFSTGEGEGMGLTRTGNGVAVWTENKGLFLLDPESPFPRDERVTQGLARANTLMKSGLVKMAGATVRELLVAVEPGHPELNLLNARIYTQMGDPVRALSAWERCLHSSEPAFLLQQNITEPLRKLSGARWTAYLPSAARFTPMLMSGERLVVPGTGELSLLSLKDGRLLWRYRLQSPTEPVLNGCVINHLFVGQAEGELLALDLDLQAERWKVPFRKSVTALAPLDRDFFVAGTWSEGAFLIETATGRVARVLLEQEKAIFPWATGNYLWLAGLTGGLRAFRGTQERFSLALGSPLLAVFAAAGDRIFVPTGDGRLCALSETNGQLLWRASTGVQVSSLAADRDRVYSVLSGPAAWAAHDPASGKRIWLRRNGSFQPEMAVCGTGFLALAGDNKIILCDPATGDTRRQWVLAGRIASLITDQKALFVRLENGLVYAFDTGL